MRYIPLIFLIFLESFGDCSLVLVLDLTVEPSNQISFYVYFFGNGLESFTVYGRFYRSIELQIRREGLFFCLLFPWLALRHLLYTSC